MGQRPALSTSLTLQDNQPLLLRDVNAAWYVSTGSLALFAVQVDANQEPISQCRYLLTNHAGEWNLGTGVWAGKTADYALLFVVYHT